MSMLPHAGSEAEGGHPEHPETRREVSPELASAGWPGGLHRFGAALLVLSICGLELRAVLGPYEDWPFTSAPMFARYQTPGDPLFELSFYVEDPAGVSVELEPLKHLGIGELGFRRHFFARYYGSTDPKHPSWHLPNDTESAFRTRMNEWMGLVAQAYARKQGHLPRRLSLEASRLARGQRHRRPLFEFVPATGELRTGWVQGAAGP